ncbi:MAG TPA: TolC family protein, partial [Chitinispirillaceae bacterium]|nr:TolC family protein [Chitinispirillaceae bacterium]
LFTLASMDKDPDSIELTDSLAVVEFTISEGEAIDLMLNKNLSLKQIDNGIQLHQMQIEIAKCDFFPTVYAGASVSKISMFDSYDRTSWGDDQKIFIGASIPIYSGGQKVQKVKQVSFEEQSLHETKRKTISQLTLALNNYFEELAVAREECIEARHLISLTEQGVEISSLSYEIGQITQNELTQSKQHLSMSQLAYNNAVYKLNTAIANIKMLLGDETLLSTKVED